MRFSFDYQRNKIDLDVEECRNVFQKMQGLMFRRKSKPLLFVFKNRKIRAIHSFFCKPFIAIWFDENRIVDSKLVKSWRVSVKPKKKFDKLLEIPSSDKNFFRFIDEERKV